MSSNALPIPLFKTGVIVLEGNMQVAFANPRALELFASRSPTELATILSAPQHELRALLAQNVSAERVLKLDGRELHLHVAPGAGVSVVFAHDAAFPPTFAKCLKAASIARTKERMAGTLVHSLKGPMHSITLALEVLRRTSGDETRPYLESIGKDIARLNSTIETSLAGARKVKQMSEFELSAVLKEVASTMRVEAAMREARIKVSGAAGVTIAGRRGDIEHAIAAVLLNALDTSAEGAEIEVKLATEEKWARITVVGGGAPRPELQPDHEIDLEVAGAIAREHGGELYPDSSRRVCFKFPLKRIETGS